MFTEATRQADEDDQNPFGNERVHQDKLQLAKHESKVEPIMTVDEQNQDSCVDEHGYDTVLPMTRGGAVPLVDVAREWVRLQIQRLGITEKDFGIKVGIAASSLNDMLKGKRRVHFDHLLKMANALDMESSSVLKVMMDICREIEGSRDGYATLPGRARGYVLAEQKEAVRKALSGLRKPHKKDDEEENED